jgi:hypothetical protein
LAPAIGLTTGLEARVGGRHLALIPGFRLRLNSGNRSSTYPGGGPPKWTLTSSVAGRVDF